MVQLFTIQLIWRKEEKKVLLLGESKKQFQKKHFKSKDLDLVQYILQQKDVTKYLNRKAWWFKNYKMKRLTVVNTCKLNYYSFDIHFFGRALKVVIKSSQ